MSRLEEVYLSRVMCAVPPPKKGKGLSVPDLIR